MDGDANIGQSTAHPPPASGDRYISVTALQHLSNAELAINCARPRARSTPECALAYTALTGIKPGSIARSGWMFAAELVRVLPHNSADDCSVASANFAWTSQPLCEQELWSEDIHSSLRHSAPSSLKMHEPSSPITLKQNETSFPHQQVQHESKQPLLRCPSFALKSKNIELTQCADVRENMDSNILFRKESTHQNSTIVKTVVRSSSRSSRKLDDSHKHLLMAPDVVPRVYFKRKDMLRPRIRPREKRCMPQSIAGKCRADEAEQLALSPSTWPLAPSFHEKVDNTKMENSPAIENGHDNRETTSEIKVKNTRVPARPDRPSESRRPLKSKSGSFQVVQPVTRTRSVANGQHGPFQVYEFPHKGTPKNGYVAVTETDRPNSKKASPPQQKDRRSLYSDQTTRQKAAVLAVHTSLNSVPEEGIKESEAALRHEVSRSKQHTIHFEDELHPAHKSQQTRDTEPVATTAGKTGMEAAEADTPQTEQICVDVDPQQGLSSIQERRNVVDDNPPVSLIEDDATLVDEEGEIATPSMVELHDHPIDEPVARGRTATRAVPDFKAMISAFLQQTIDERHDSFSKDEAKTLHESIKAETSTESSPLLPSYFAHSTEDDAGKFCPRPIKRSILSSPSLDRVGPRMNGLAMHPP